MLKHDKEIQSIIEIVNDLFGKNVVEYMIILTSQIVPPRFVCEYIWNRT